MLACKVHSIIAARIIANVMVERELVLAKTKHVSKKAIFRFASKVGTRGFNVEAGILRRVSKFTKLGMSVELGTNGVTLCFCFQRAGQKYPP